jgi:GT2 family glycosyltransferase
VTTQASIVPLDAGPLPLPDDLDLVLVARRPARLPEATARLAENLPVPVTPGGSAGVPRASIIIVTFNNLAFTKLCLTSVLANADPTTFELIVVDNGSADGSPQWLCAVADANPHVRLVLNDDNRGFAAANNQALAAARGDAIVLLNNDTIVPPGWLPRLLAHLEDPAIGLAGPVTNRIGNEAEIGTTYRTYGDMVRFADQRARDHCGVRFDIPTPCMFCLALRRDALDRIGPLDERFEVGMLEDDDYARRAHAQGYQVVCAEDTFVHHFGQASFGTLVPTGEYSRLLEANRKRFEAKWGEAWRPYARRSTPEYGRIKRAIRDAVFERTPQSATVLVASRGDEDLLDLLREGGRRAWHFPRAADGAYAGHYPADSEAAVAALREAEEKGAEYLVIPTTAFWWLDCYPGLRAYLQAAADRPRRTEGACDIYPLGRKAVRQEHG